MYMCIDIDCLINRCQNHTTDEPKTDLRTSSGQVLQSQKNENKHQQEQQQQQDHTWIQERHGLLPGGDRSFVGVRDWCRNTSDFHNGMGLHLEK